MWDLYEIPITSLSLPSRKPTRRVAPQLTDSGGVWIEDGPDLIHRKMPSRKHAEAAQANTRGKELLMWDIAVLALGLGFFVAGIGYAYACERL